MCYQLTASSYLSKMLFLRKIFVTISLLAVLAISVRGQPDSCIADPCEGAECPRFLGADCRVNQELCTTNFFWKGRDVTNRCPVPTCDDRECGRNRDCMEEVFPPSCPRGTSCRQFIRTRCVLRPFEKPMTCADVECGEGMMCRFRERPGGFRPVVRCVPAVPEDCSEIECEEDFMCVLRGRRPICVRDPSTSPPITTEPIIPTEPIICSQLQVTCDLGFQCIETDTGPTCTPSYAAETCSQLNCIAFFLVCFQVSERLALCFPPIECTDEFNERCQEIGTVCGTTDSGKITCVPASSCDQIVCGENMTCSEVTTNGTSFVSCIPIGILPNFALACEDLTCPEGQGCYMQSFPEVNLTFAQCFSESTLDAFEGISASIDMVIPTCDSIRCPNFADCVDIREGERQVLPRCLPSGCTNSSQCPPGFSTCADGLCPPDRVQFEPGLFDSCEEINRECPQGMECRDIYRFNILVGTICIPHLTFQSFSRTCGDIECTGDDGCLIGTIPSRPSVLPLAQCLVNFDAVTGGIIQGLRALGLIP